MWSIIKEKFQNYPAQEKVVKLLLDRGFQINTLGHVVSGSIEIPHTQIAKEIGVDRRVIDATCDTILEDSTLREIFRNIHTIPSLKDVAPTLGLSVIIIEPDNAHCKGLLGSVATAVAEIGLNIRQAVADDPFISQDPQLTIIIDGNISGELINILNKIKGVKSVTIY